METPFFSVIIPTHNRSDLIARAVESVLNQEFNDLEVIVVNDASTDNTIEVLKQFDGNPKVHVITNPTNLYKGGTRNVGIKKAVGQFCAFLDDDDYFLGNHLKGIKTVIDANNGADGLYYTHPTFEDMGQPELRKSYRLIPKDGAVAYIFNHKNGLPTIDVAVNTPIAKALLFNPLVKFGQDTEFFMRIAHKYPTFMVDQNTAVTVYHGENSTELANDPGLQRREGYEQVWKNKDLMTAIPSSLKQTMLAYSHWLSGNYYESKQQQTNAIGSFMKSVWANPLDSQTPSNIVRSIYNLTDLIGITKKFKK